MLKDQPKYSKRVITENYEATLGKCKFQPRDFGATFMSCPELSKGIKRAERRKVSKPEKADMYTAQIKSYKSRLDYYFN